MVECSFVNQLQESIRLHTDPGMPILILTVKSGEDPFKVYPWMTNCGSLIS